MFNLMRWEELNDEKDGRSLPGDGEKSWCAETTILAVTILTSMDEMP